jgi:sec-independent protein translocase protein TatA
MPGGWEWIAIGVVMLLLFGSRLPSVARSIGDAMREFKKGVSDIADDTNPNSKYDSRAERPYSAAKPPLTSGGTDERVAHGEAHEPVRSEHKPQD